MNNILIFWSYQFSQIKEEGWTAVWRKLKRLTIRLLLVIIAIPPVLFVRLIQPFIWIRFGPIRSDVFGHHVFDPEYYLTERELVKSKSIDCFYFQTKILPNKHWPLMLHRYLRINPIFEYLDRANQLIPGGDKHYKPIVYPGSRDIKGYLCKTKPHINFTSEENNQGRQFLERLGMNSSDRFVCLIARDKAYKNARLDGRNRDWSYHNYRDSDIKTYEDAALALADKGYWVFRMGKIVQESFKANHPRIIDYTNTKYRSDFLDIWLMSNCFYSISTACGLDSISQVNRISICFVNALPLGHINTTSNPFSIWLPKNVIWEKNKKPLTLKEQINTGIIGFLHSEDYKNAKVELVDNLPEEITDTVLELEAKLTGNWQSHPQDDQLQNEFWAILKTWEEFPKYHGKLQGKMPDTFLRENHDWFLV